MLGVLNWCIKYKAAGDQFVGKKFVSGRSRNSSEFTVSPVYFALSKLSENVESGNIIVNCENDHIYISMSTMTILFPNHSVNHSFNYC